MYTFQSVLEIELSATPASTVVGLAVRVSKGFRHAIRVSEQQRSASQLNGKTRRRLKNSTWK